LRNKRFAALLLSFLLAYQLLFIATPATALAEDSPTRPDFLIDTPYNPPFLAGLPTGPLPQKFGIATHPWWLEMFLDRFIEYYKDLKITTVRLPFEWKAIELQPDIYDWSREDRLLNRLSDEGFEVVAEFVTVPVWASSNPEECAKEDLNCRLDPKYASQLAKIAKASVKRYPFIRHWEFWNEPDLWPNFGQKDIGDYAPWLKIFYDAAKSTDPDVMVAATSLSGYEYTAWLYDHTGAVYGMYPFDAVAYHPYTPEKCQIELKSKRVSMNMTGVERLRRLMVEHGDADKPIWLTEVGWLGSPEIQTRCLEESFDYIANRPFITLAHVHMLHDWESEQFGLMSVKENIFWKRPLKVTDEFIPKQPFYDAFKFYDKRPLPVRPTPDDNTLVFPQTRHTVRGPFKKAWLKGGLELFGYPNTGQFYERNPADNKYYLVQYFERVRMEYHPEYAGTPNEVLFGLLGNQLLTERGWINRFGLPVAGPALPEPKPAVTNDELIWFRETEHTLSGPFLKAWKKQGGLMIVGLPKTSIFEEVNPDDGGRYRVQYFERARMELHPGKGNEPELVLFGLLGNDRLRLQNRLGNDNQPNFDNYFNPALPEFK
jgi:hypothetical protein